MSSKFTQMKKWRSLTKNITIQNTQFNTILVKDTYIHVLHVHMCVRDRDSASFLPSEETVIVATPL